MLDVYRTGDVERISPEAPVPVVRVRDRKHALGGAANVAQNILAIGCECTLVAAIGSSISANDPSSSELSARSTAEPTAESCQLSVTCLLFNVNSDRL